MTLEGSLSSIPVYGIGAYVVQIPNVSDSGIAPTATPTSTPTATPVSNEWLPHTMAIPVWPAFRVGAGIADINFNWGYGSPGPDVPVDDFSALFERTLRFYAPREYRLCLCNLDDGARLWMNGELLSTMARRLRP